MYTTSICVTFKGTDSLIKGTGSLIFNLHSTSICVTFKGTDSLRVNLTHAYEDKKTKENNKNYFGN